MEGTGFTWLQNGSKSKKVATPPDNIELILPFYICLTIYLTILAEFDQTLNAAGTENTLAYLAALDGAAAEWVRNPSSPESLFLSRKTAPIIAPRGLRAYPASEGVWNPSNSTL